MADEYLLGYAKRKKEIAEELELIASKKRGQHRLSDLTEAKRLRQEASNLRFEWKSRNSSFLYVPFTCMFTLKNECGQPRRCSDGRNFCAAKGSCLI